MNIKKAIQTWLDIQKPRDYTADLRKESDKVAEMLTEAQKEMEFWKGIAKQFSAVPCGFCGKNMYVYPFGDAYYKREGKPFHPECLDKYLNKAQRTSLPQRNKNK